MTWSDFYLTCFVVGLLLSVVTLLLGDLHMHLHFPFHIHFGHFDVGAPDAPQAGGPHSAGQLPAINFGTITAFLAWFGAAGYLLTRHSHLYALTALALACLGGLVGASIVFLMLSKVLMRHEQNLDPADYEMIGVLGRLTNPIFAGGTGEMIFSRDGARHTCGVRSEDGSAIPKGSEVIVTRYEKGLAYVRCWEEMAEEGLGATQIEGKGGNTL